MSRLFNFGSHQEHTLVDRLFCLFVYLFVFIWKKKKRRLMTSKSHSVSFLCWSCVLQAFNQTFQRCDSVVCEWALPQCIPVTTLSWVSMDSGTLGPPDRVERRRKCQQWREGLISFVGACHPAQTSASLSSVRAGCWSRHAHLSPLNVCWLYFFVTITIFVNIGMDDYSSPVMVALNFLLSFSLLATFLSYCLGYVVLFGRPVLDC